MIVACSGSNTKMHSFLHDTGLKLISSIKNGYYTYSGGFWEECVVYPLNYKNTHDNMWKILDNLVFSWLKVFNSDNFSIVPGERNTQVTLKRTQEWDKPVLKQQHGFIWSDTASTGTVVNQTCIAIHLSYLQIL